MQEGSPGHVIAPQQNQDQQPAEPAKTEPVQDPTPNTQEQPAVEQAASIDGPNVSETDQPSNWEYTDSTVEAKQSAGQPSTTQTSDDAMAWTASEFIAHQKSAGWYARFCLVAVALAGVVYIITRDVVSVGVIVLVAIGFAFLATRKPRTVSYSVSGSGIQIGQKLYPYGLFKTFSRIEEGAVDSIMLMPLKRFSPPISMYYPPEDEDHIISVLSNYLPHEDRRLDAIEELMHRIRF